MDTVAEKIRKEKVMSFDDVLNCVDCSDVTLRRDFKALKALTSFTHRGHFVTLPEVARFNAQGIWFHKHVGFSRFGTSLDSIVGLIELSKEGLSKVELEAILRIGISKQIQILMQRGKLHRVKLGNRYLYLPEAVQKNKRKKLRLIGDRQTEEYFEKGVPKTDLVALLKAVLIEKKVGVDVESIKRIAKKYSLRLPLQKIQRLLVKYDLPVKKSPEAGD
ncbi:MAG: hypothetical protein GY800_04005 [Planctomycetes bacterium]|nr:hypothetical protein [Planctomycetota bacterium]